MTKRLSLDQLLTIENLTGRQYHLNGNPRDRPRTHKESDNLGIPLNHLIGLPWISRYKYFSPGSYSDRPKSYGLDPMSYPHNLKRLNKSKRLNKIKGG